MSAPQAPRRAAPAPPLIPGPARAPDEGSPATAAARGLQVLVVGLDYGPPHAGTAPGTTSYTTVIAGHLASVAAGVTVLTAVPQGADGRVPTAYRRGLRTAEPGWYSPEQPRVVRLRRYSPRRRAAPGSVRRALRELTFLANAVSAGRRWPADLVVGVTPGGGAAAAAWLARRAGAPLITVVQSPVEAAAMKITPAGDDAGGDAVRHGVVRQVRDAVRGAASRICPALERYALRRSTQVAVGSETSRGRLLAAGVEPGRLHLLPAWSPVAPSTLTRVAARRELGWEQARFIAVHAGPLGHRQDGVTIVEAARLLAADSGLLSEIVLAGDGPQRAALEQLAFGIPGLRFMGGVDDETLPLVLAAADVLLVAETSPAGAATASGQLASYLAAGRPVVAVSWPSSPTAAELRRAGAGLRVPPGDPAALARALAGLRPAVARQGAMGRAALRYARAHLGREASLRRLDAIVEAALTEPGSH